MLDRVRIGSWKVREKLLEVTCALIGDSAQGSIGARFPAMHTDLAKPAANPKPLARRKPVRRVLRAAKASQSSRSPRKA